MRFMVIVRFEGNCGEGRTPTKAQIAAMTKLKHALVEAGVVEASEVFPPAPAKTGSRPGKRKAIPPPFSRFCPAPDDFGGSWLMKVKSDKEMGQWFRRINAAHGKVVEMLGLPDPEEVTPTAKRRSGKKVAGAKKPHKRRAKTN